MRTRTPPVLLSRLRGDHDNLHGLALVIESLLARLHGGEAIDRVLLMDAVCCASAYLEQVHEPREARAVEAIAAKLPVVRALRPVAASYAAELVTARAALPPERELAASPASDVVRWGFAYTRALRKRIAFEESLVLSFARLAPAVMRSVHLGVEEESIEANYRALFEALTSRAGCGCAFE